MPTPTPTMHCCCGRRGTSWSVLSISTEVHTQTVSLLLLSWLSVDDFFWLTHCSSSWSSVDDGSLQRGARGRGQPRVRPPCPIRVQRRLPGKISLSVWSVALNCELWTRYCITIAVMWWWSTFRWPKNNYLSNPVTHTFTERFGFKGGVQHLFKSKMRVLFAQHRFWFWSIYRLTGTQSNNLTSCTQSRHWLLLNKK